MDTALSFLAPGTTIPETLAAAILVIGVALLLVAALHDVAARTVPNSLVLAVAGAGLAAQALAGELTYALPAALAVFVGAAICWRRGWMGGGDVKLLAAAALVVPPVLVPSMLASTALAGGLLASVYLVARRRVRLRRGPRPPHLVSRAVRAERWRLRRGGPLPYAVAIASGACFVLTRGGLL